MHARAHEVWLSVSSVCHCHTANGFFSSIINRSMPTFAIPTLSVALQAFDGRQIYTPHANNNQYIARTYVAPENNYPINTDR